jgi:calmodulin
MPVPAQLLSEMDGIWKRYDKGGEIALKDVGKVARACGLNPSQEDVKNAEKKFGGSSVGMDKFKPWFIKLYEDYADSSDQIVDYFRVFDRDGQGFITLADFRSVLGTMGEKLDEKEIETCLRECDIKNGLIDYEDFTKTIFGES